MAYGKYSWAKASSPTLEVPLKPGVDPEHLTPTDNVEFVDMQPLWVANPTSVPTLPDSLVGDLGGGPIGGGGPLDYTPTDSWNPTDTLVGVPPSERPSEYGVGVGPGLTLEEAQEIRGVLMSEDLGAYAARHYQAMTDRQSNPGLAVSFDTPGNGDSPQTLIYQRPGVGSPIDPDARVGRREKRWWDQVWDMHWWNDEYRPMTNRTINREIGRGPVQGGNQYTSPFDNTIMQNPGSPDSFVAPQVRRTPVEWGEPITTDGIVVNSSTGLSSWGL